jgi:hypothetical protein
VAYSNAFQRKPLEWVYTNWKKADFFHDEMKISDECIFFDGWL